MRLLILLMTLFCCGCSESPSSFDYPYQIIEGRDQGDSLLRSPLYHVQVPTDWIRVDPLKDQSIQDTTRALCEFIIKETDGQVRITIHNFPLALEETRIPPEAQMARWRRQMNPQEEIITPQSQSGFTGFLYECTGKLEEKEVEAMGWIMQLAPEHYSHLSFKRYISPKADQFYKQMAADFTIKAVGPSALLARYKEEIRAFARSFELIQEIPKK